MLLDGDFCIDQPPGFTNPGFEIRLATGLGFQLSIDSSEVGLNLFARFHEFEDFVLHPADLGLQKFDLPTEIVGVPSAQATGIEPHLLGTGLLLRDLKLTGRLVDREFDLAQASAGLVTCSSKAQGGLMGCPVVGQFGEVLTLIDQAIDVSIDVLQIEEVVQTPHGLHAGSFRQRHSRLSRSTLRDDAEDRRVPCFGAREIGRTRPTQTRGLDTRAMPSSMCCSEYPRCLKTFAIG